jgi:uncharacterized protein (TIGR00255 family)
MIRSMTGYGKATGMVGEKQITVEIKALNSKQFDFNIKLPALYVEIENEMRTVVAQSLERGKVFCAVQIDEKGQQNIPGLNVELASAWYEEWKQLEARIGLPPAADYHSLLLRMPDFFKTTEATAPDQEKEVLMDTLKEAIQQLNHFREKEGEVLGKDIAQRIRLIESFMEQIVPFEKTRLSKLKERMEKALQEIAGNGISIDQNRLEQEMIFHVERLDITEEKVRLRNHLRYFLEVMDLMGGGRKLGFIAQEIGREINTIGSKANDSGIQQVVVDMKDELEKVKEQLFNVL